MIAKTVVAGMALMLSFSTGSARATVCLDKSMTSDEIVETINAAPLISKYTSRFARITTGTAVLSQ